MEGNASHVHICALQHTTLTAQRGALSVRSATLLLPPPTEQTTFTITDGDATTTWIRTPNQSATLAAHPLNI